MPLGVGVSGDNNINEIYSLHNIPGYEKGSILIKDDVFACTSKGLIISLKGKPSHAAYPEFGVNPSNATADIIKFINNIDKIDNYMGMVLCTIIHVSLGERAFGTSAGFGEIMVTIRAENEIDLLNIEDKIRSYTYKIAMKEKLSCEISFCDEFPETRNHKDSVTNIRKCAKKNCYSFEDLSVPFRWSEDFGHFLKHTKGAMFGIGAGLNQPQLHTVEYDFPDEIIATGSEFLYSLLTTA